MISRVLNTYCNTVLYTVVYGALLYTVLNGGIYTYFVQYIVYCTYNFSTVIPYNWTEMTTYPKGTVQYSLSCMAGR